MVKLEYCMIYLKWIVTYSSIVGSDSSKDEHQEESDNKLEDERLDVGPCRDCPEEAVVPAAKQQTHRSTGECRAH